MGLSFPDSIAITVAFAASSRKFDFSLVTF